MDITLYKNCCLNNKYTEVFALGYKNPLDATSSPFLLYLNSLTKTTIAVDGAFMENSGILIFDYNLPSSNIYEYNYMKVSYDLDDEHTIVRYCFIDKILIRNEVVYLSYSEDYWHNYSDKIKGFNPSHLISSRVIKEFPSSLIYGILKEDYDSFDGIDFTPLVDYLGTEKYSLIVEIQLYKLIAVGGDTEKGERYPLYINIYDASDNQLTLTTFQSVLAKFIQNMTEGKINATNPLTGTAENFKYDIGSIYVFPGYFCINDHTLATPTLSIKDSNDTTIAVGHYLDLASMQITKTISVNLDSYKKIGIGTFKSRVQYTNNKLKDKSDLNIYAQASSLGIMVKLEFQGQIIDITEDFNLHYPVEMLSAQEYKLEKLNKQLSDLSNSYAIYEELWNMNNNFASTTDKNMQAVTNFGGNSNVSSENANEAGAYVAMAKMFSKANANAMENYSQNIKSGGVILRNVMAIVKRNAQVYGVNKGIFGINNSNVYNIIYGLLVFSKESINDTYVKAVINNYGYGTDAIIDNSNYTNLKIQDANYFQNLLTPINYNYLQFDGACVYGEFTNEIATTLNGILNAGVKIWYKETRTDDTLVIG